VRSDARRRPPRRIAPAALALLALPLLARPLAGAEVEVQSTPAGLKVRARSAPLADVLDQFSRQTGMKIQYEGMPPRSLVTVEVLRATPTETLLGVLEGQGLNFAMLMDSTGTNVERLVLMAPTAAGPSTPAPRPATARSFPVNEPAVQEEPVEEEPEEPEPEAQPQPAPGAQPAPPGDPAARPPVFQPPGANPAPYPASPFGTQQPVMPLLPPGVPVPGQPAPGQPGGAEAPAPSPTPPPNDR
jgi:hypothetical protein